MTGLEALRKALEEAKHFGSSWGRLDTPLLEAAIEEHVKLARVLGAVRAVRVIDGEFVDAGELYRALGEQLPPRVRVDQADTLADRWREHALDFAAEIRDLRRQVDGYQAAERTMTEINNLNVAELRQLRAEAQMHRWRYGFTVFDDVDGSIVLAMLCRECMSTNKDASVLSARAGRQKISESGSRAYHGWSLEQLTLAARQHDKEQHGRPGKRRRRPHNRAERRAQTQERETP